MFIIEHKNNKMHVVVMKKIFNSVLKTFFVI